MPNGQFSLADVAPVQGGQGQYSLADTQAPANSYQPGFLHAMGSDLLGAVKGMAHMGASTVLTQAGVSPNIQRQIGVVPLEDSLGKQLADIPSQWQERKAAGYNLPYRVAAVPAGFIANVPGMEEAAKQGDISGVAGHMVAGQLQAAAPLIGEGVIKGVNRIVPSTTRAGAGLQALTDSPQATYAQHPVETPNALKIANKIESQLAITGERPPAIIQNYMAGEQLRNAPPEIMSQLREQGVAPPQSMTMYEARTTLKRVNDMIDASGGFGADTASKTMVNALKRFAGALDQDITSAAQQGGFGKEYSALRAEYAKGRGIQRAGEELGPSLGALGGYMGGRELGAPLGVDLAAGYVGRHLAKPVIGGMVNSVIERPGGPVSPTLPMIPRTPEEYTRTLLAAKEGEITPGEANRRIAKGGGKVSVAPIPRPPE